SQIYRTKQETAHQSYHNTGFLSQIPSQILQESFEQMKNPLWNMMLDRILY
nr:hypothetical protein [Tanacetum cinerariifolium]